MVEHRAVTASLRTNVRSVLPSSLLPATTLFLIGGPILAFPDVLPSAWRTPATTVIALVALVLALWMLRTFDTIRPWLWIFAAALVGSWFVHGGGILGLRHFAGTTLGVLAMALVAGWCTTHDRLIAAAAFFALASVAVVTVGLLATSISSAKLVVGATRMESSPAFRWLPGWRLPLPGTEGNERRVNPNALGGTALMLLPTCAGLAAAALALRHRRGLLIAAFTATATTAAVLVLSRSRVALIAALLTAVVVALRWRRMRWWIVGALVCALAVAGAYAARSRAAAPDDFAEGVRYMRHSADLRLALWRGAVDRLRASPWLGIGINAFHETNAPEGVYAAEETSTPVAHAHNIVLQVTLDVGLAGLAGYLLLFGRLVQQASRLPTSVPAARIAAGAGASLIAVHFFGLGDAIALGAKVGIFQWLSAGIILAASRVLRTTVQS